MATHPTWDTMRGGSEGSGGTEEASDFLEETACGHRLGLREQDLPHEPHGKGQGLSTWGDPCITAGVSPSPQIPTRPLRASILGTRDRCKMLTSI